MKILSASELKLADVQTANSLPGGLSSLMDIAAKACARRIAAMVTYENRLAIICGKGNNGGDGLAIATILHDKGFEIVVYLICESGSTLFNEKLEDLRQRNIQPSILTEDKIPDFSSIDVIIDCLLGTGVQSTPSGIYESVIAAINEAGVRVISVDMPSGLPANTAGSGIAVKATHTLTLNSPKLSLLFPANAVYTGRMEVVDIGLDGQYIATLSSQKYFLTEEEVRTIIRPRGIFSHKGDYGHALLVSGAYGKAGAAVLAARAALRTGCGLLSIVVPRKCVSVLQTCIPEAMVIASEEDEVIALPLPEIAFDAFAIGPGIGQSESAANVLSALLKRAKSPVVIDADALNILSQHPENLKFVPSHSILTPHVKEFERLAGKSTDDYDRHEKQINYSVEKNVIVVLKGRYTCISLPDGSCYFNPTGNPGMAKGGSGDVLTGMIVGLLAQKYPPHHAAILGVYLHGLAGDIAAEEKTEYSLLAGDLVEAIPQAYKKLTAPISG